jgi:hypothetical protein
MTGVFPHSVESTWAAAPIAAHIFIIGRKCYKHGQPFSP